LSALTAGTPPHATVILAGGEVNVGAAAGVTVIVLTAVMVLPHASVAVHVSVTEPPQVEGVAEKVDGLEMPVIKQPPLNPLAYVRVLGDGIEPHATVMSAGAVIVGNTAGLTVIVLDTEAIVLPQGSVAVHVSVTVPPQAEGVAEKVDGLEVPVIKQPALNPFV